MYYYHKIRYKLIIYDMVALQGPCCTCSAFLGQGQLGEGHEIFPSLHRYKVMGQNGMRCPIFIAILLARVLAWLQTLSQSRYFCKVTFFVAGIFQCGRSCFFWLTDCRYRLDGEFRRQRAAFRNLV